MKSNKKGISLIVLVITIIVIIILAAAVVMSLSNNNVLTNSRQAVNESDFSEIQSSFQIKMQGVLVKQLDSVVISGDINAGGFDGCGYAGVLDSALTKRPTASTISQGTQDLIKSITIASLDLSDKFTHVAISDNKVVAMVKNGQLIVKNASNDKLEVIDANYGIQKYETGKTFDPSKFTDTVKEENESAVKSELWNTYSTSSAYTKGFVIKSST